MRGTDEMWGTNRKMDERDICADSEHQKIFSSDKITDRRENVVTKNARQSDREVQFKKEKELFMKLHWYTSVWDEY